MNGSLVLRALIAIARLSCVASFAAFCVLTLIQVVNRYLIGWPLFWTEEVAVLLFVWSVMVGLPVALWERQEIAVELFPLPDGRLRRVLRGAADLVSLVFLVLLAVSGWMLIDRAGGALTPAIGLARAWAYASIPVGAALGAVVLVARWWRDRNTAGGAAPGEPGPGDAGYAHD